MTTTQTHWHTCRDCSESFKCSTPDTANGCPVFDGSCPDCHAAEGGAA